MADFNLLELLREYDGFGKTYYSPFFGEVTLDEDNGKLVFTDTDDNLCECPDYVKALYDDGKWSPDGELAVLPSREQRDWNVWAEEQKQLMSSSNKIKEGDYIKMTYNNKQSWGKVQEVDNLDSGTPTFVVDEQCEGMRILVNVNSKNIKKIDKFTPELLKPFDKVLVATKSKNAWYISHFGKIAHEDVIECANGTEWRYAIPYNKETSMLLHNKDAEIPDFYNTKKVKE